MWTLRMRSLPPDLLAESCKRVGIAALVFAVLWAIGILMGGVLRGLLGAETPVGVTVWPMPGVAVATVGLVISLTMVMTARRLHDRPHLLLTVGLVFEVVTAFLFGMLNEWEPRIMPARISWVCVIILVYPAIVPNTPGKTLTAAVAAASMDPLWYAIGVMRGTPVFIGTSAIAGDPSSLQLVWYFLPAYLCAALAVIPAHIIRGLGRQISKARELGSYQLGDEVGTGGMGTVFRAEHRLLARPAAIKIVRPELLGAASASATAIMLTRFKREAEAAALLRSPHTIELYDFGVAADGTFYLVMELLDGVGFDGLVERFGPLQPERAVHLIAQACESLAEAHAKGLMHRDIKPSNLHTTRMGLVVDFVKVLDFGLVKAEPGSGREQTMLTSPDITAGTPAFMAPEAALAEDDIDHRVDVYSLGCVLYWLLTGQLVFEASSAIKMMHRHIQDAPDPPSRHSELPIPAALDALVLACLAKSPADRPADGAALGRALEGISFANPWTRERARRWWETHLPVGPAWGPCDKGELVPATMDAQR